MSILIADRVKFLKSSGIRQIMTKAQELESKGHVVIHLEVGEPNFSTPTEIVSKTIDSLNNGIPGYTPNLGRQSLRKKVANRFNNSYQLKMLTDNVAITSGAVNGLILSLLAILNKDDEVLIPDPGWPNYDSCVTLAGGKPVYYNLSVNNDFSINFNDLEKKISGKTKAILINFPGNPTGAVTNEIELERLVNLALEKDIFIISDEVYESYSFQKKHITIKQVSSSSKLIVVSGASKTFAMTGWRLGWVIADIKIIHAIGALIEPITSCPSTVAQYAVEHALNASNHDINIMKQAYKHRAKTASKILAEANILIAKPQGAFYVMADISKSGLSSDEFVLRLLNEKKVAVAPGSTFGKISKDMIRISVAASEEDLKEGCKIIINYISELSSINTNILKEKSNENI